MTSCNPRYISFDVDHTYSRNFSSIVVIALVMSRDNLLWFDNENELNQREQQQQLTEEKLLSDKDLTTISRSNSHHFSNLKFCWNFALRSSCLLKSFGFQNISTVETNTVSTCKNTQNRRLLSQLDETTNECIIGNTDKNTQDAGEVEKADANTEWNNANHLITESISRLNMQTPEKSVCDNMRCEVKNFVASVETTVHDTILSVMDNLVLRRKELAMRSTDASLTRHPSSIVLNSDVRDFLGDKKWLQMTVSSSFNSNINLNRFDETLCNITVEVGDLPITDRNFDRETHPHHRCTVRTKFSQAKRNFSLSKKIASSEGSNDSDPCLIFYFWQTSEKGKIY